MKRTRTLAAAATFVLILIGLSASASAIPLPDASACNGTGANGCFKITNNSPSSNGSSAMVAEGSNNSGIVATSTSAFGVEAASTNSLAIYAASASNYGVYATGVLGGVHAQSASGVGVEVSSSLNDGIHTVTSTAAHAGLSAENVTSGGGGFGVWARAGGTGQAVHGENSGSGWAGYFSGRLFASSGYKPGGGSWTDSSDLRLKKNVKPLEGALGKLLRLNGVTFEWKDPKSHGDLSGRQTGMIAQDVEKVFPEWVGVDSEGFRTLTFRGFEALSVEAMRTLQTENEALRSQVSRLEDRVSKMEGRRPIAMAGFTTIDIGLVSGLALLVGAFLVSRRRRLVPAT